MSREGDRIAVPTNGHRPPLSGEDTTIDVSPDADDVVDPAIPVAARRGVAINATPAQLAVGFGILAWILVVLAGRRRRKG